MPKISVEGGASAEVAAGKRLVLALTEDLQVDQLHACGGKARCTTCRVEFVSGEPAEKRPAEEAALSSRQLSGVRLSCQIECQHDMEVRIISRFEGSGRKDAGSPVSPTMEP
ncbi:MAG: 2Fe-2S iron-sulfur cluster binding domain-containing protein [Pirellulaceae bacterium]|nr:2Fe-2S iron-sulfur cluster binding domain-containing protein [Pirellulaceae bacterium]